MGDGTLNIVINTLQNTFLKSVLFCIDPPNAAMLQADMTLAIPKYQQILADEFEKRTLKNPRYSLRAFSRDIELAPSRVSEILRFKQGMSRACAFKIATNLGFSRELREWFCDLVESQTSRNDRRRTLAIKRLRKSTQKNDYQDLSLDVFKAIAGWEHFAILEMCKMPRVKIRPTEIAKFLKIGIADAESALERLLRLGLLKKGSRGKYQVGNYAISSAMASEAIQSGHRALLRKAEVSLSETPVEERDFSAMTMAFASEDIALAKTKLRDFRREFDKKLSRPQQSDRVYCLAVQFFPISATAEQA